MKEPARDAIRLLQGKTTALADGTSLLLTQYVVEEIAASPEDPESYPAGSGVVISIRVNTTDLQLSDLSAGYDSKRIAWVDDIRVQLVDADTLGQVSVHVDQRTDQVIAGSAESARVERGRSIQLDGSLYLKFDGHGHKMVRKGQKSPLMVRAEYRTRAQVEKDVFTESLVDEQTHMLYPPEESMWRWRDFEFELKEHKYDQFMQLEISRLAMKPLP